jgi:hypothetical protein
MEHSIGRVSENFPQQLSDALRFRWKFNVVDERCIEVDHVERLEPSRVLDQRRASSNCIHKPRLAPYITGIQNSLALSLKYCEIECQKRERERLDWCILVEKLTEHDSTRAMVCVKERHLNMVARREFNRRRSFQGQRFLKV